MKLPRDLKGSDLAKALCRDWGYRIVHQEGSHLILQTEIPSQRIQELCPRERWGRSPPQAGFSWVSASEKRRFSSHFWLKKPSFPSVAPRNFVNLRVRKRHLKHGDTCSHLLREMLEIVG
jgi:hypothetical protein